MEPKTNTANKESPVIKISLGWLGLIVIIIFLIGSVGGAVGSSFINPPLPPLTQETEQLISTTQEVTISPSRAAEKLAEENARAIVLITRDGQSVPAINAIVLTNDGLAVSAHDIEGSSLFAIDNTGLKVPVSRIGRDELFDLSYFRLDNSVIQPFAIADQDVKAGAKLLALGRDRATLGLQAAGYDAISYALPQTTSPAGWHKLVALGNVQDGFDGAVLLNDNGQLAGLVAGNGTQAIPASALRLSLNRVTNNQRETDPFGALGIDIGYQIIFNELSLRYEFAAVAENVSPRLPAGAAGMVKGDVILSVNETVISWDNSLAGLLDITHPLSVKIRRGSQEQTLTINPASLQS